MTYFSLAFDTQHRVVWQNERWVKGVLVPIDNFERQLGACRDCPHRVSQLILFLQE